MDAKGMPVKIVSGGQTGVDRAALDAAISSGINHGGWCPSGRLAEDGTIPERYALVETPDADVRQRTSWNVRDSDGTLILHTSGLDEGTTFTVQAAKILEKPLFVCRIGTDEIRSVKRWIASNEIEILNVAGPRESSAPGIYRAAFEVLSAFFADANAGGFR